MVDIKTKLALPCFDTIRKMSVFEKAFVIVYRFAEKGLEIFLVSDSKEANPVWSIPERETKMTSEGLEMIELDPVQIDAESEGKAVAVEGDWHDLPSMRSLMKEDMEYVKGKIKDALPNTEEGAFVAVKDAFKKVLPHEYAMLKELKEILTDRNAVRNI